MVLAMAMISTNDALIKSASESLSISQILAIRGLMACVIFSVLIKLSGRLLFPRLMLDRANLLRGALELITTLCFVTGLSLLPIAIATTLVWTSPILLTVVGSLLLKEPVTASRWIAVLVGFAGVLLITRPFGADFSAAMILPLMAAFLVAIRDFVTRKIDARVSSFTVTFTTLIVVTACGAVLSWFNWNPVHAAQVAKLGAAAVLLAFGFLCMIKAVRLGDLSFVAPFTFTAILMALALGYVVWGDIPSVYTLLGVVLIVGTCLYLFRYDKAPLPEPPESTVP
jgi:drug/metabolite transporter (DMT)-like permease